MLAVLMLAVFRVGNIIKNIFLMFEHVFIRKKKVQ